MYIRFDESGDFDFRNSDRFWLAVIASVVVPDRSWLTVDHFVSERKREWGMPSELKAAELGERELLAIAEFFRSEELRVVGAATDSAIFPIEAQRTWRSRQVELFLQAANNSHRVNVDPITKERVDRLRLRLPSERHIKPPNFLQYFALMPMLLSRSLSAALTSFRGLPGFAESWLFNIAVDPRHGADPGKSGELLRDSVDAIFASDDRTALRVPGEWPAGHPFLVKNSDPEVGAVSPRQLMAQGLTTPDSADDAGLQLADYAPT